LINVNVDWIKLNTQPVDRLTTAAAAARLGVKRETLYAYVSRGLLHRVVAEDGRSSLFDAGEIEELASRRTGRTKREVRAAVSTSLSRVADDGLWIRGQSLAELASRGLDYEVVADLLWDSPKGEDWTGSQEPVHSGLVHSEPADSSRQPMIAGDAPLLDHLRVAVALASAGDPLRHDRSPKAVRASGRVLINRMAESLPERSRSAAGGHRLADRVWSRLARRKGQRAERDALNMAMVLLIDHGLAPSTYAARVAASVRCDPYSVALTGLGVVGGPLHGASSASVHRMLEAAAGPSGAAAAVGEVIKNLDSPPGFGHSVYSVQDHRYGPLMAALMSAWGRDPRLSVIQETRDVISSRTDALANVDLALGSLTYLAGMHADAGEVIFAISRTAGWLAHAMEEYDEQPLRFRPRASYIGPTA